MKRKLGILILIIWSIGILFPFYFMHRFSIIYRTGFDWTFKSGITHFLMHIFLYAVLAWLISLVFLDRKKKIPQVKVILIVLGISVLQETIQLVSIKYPVGLDDIFDVLVDLSGGLIGVFLFRLKKKISLQGNTENTISTSH